MKNKTGLCVVLTAGVLMLSGCGSSEPIHVNVENSEKLQGNTFGKTNLIEIGDQLWYDTTTRIVYFWNGRLNYADYSVTPSPYYAPNGKPYRYNPKTHTFEEIK